MYAIRSYYEVAGYQFASTAAGRPAPGHQVVAPGRQVDAESTILVDLNRLAVGGADQSRARIGIDVDESPLDRLAVSRKGQSTADMANSPGQRLPVFPEAIELLVSLGAVNNNNCFIC